MPQRTIAFVSAFRSYFREVGLTGAVIDVVGLIGFVLLFNSTLVSPVLLGLVLVLVSLAVSLAHYVDRVRLREAREELKHTREHETP